MPRINIVERDETLTTFESALSNVVYVPGFSNKVDAPKGLTLFTSADDFRGTIGSTPAAFNGDQTYTGAWDSAAIPTLNVMFKDGDTDPGYSYAYSLLTRDIPVVYDNIDYGSSAVKILNPGAGTEPGSDPYFIQGSTTQVTTCNPNTEATATPKLEPSDVDANKFAEEGRRPSYHGSGTQTVSEIIAEEEKCINKEYVAYITGIPEGSSTNYTLDLWLFTGIETENTANPSQNDPYTLHYKWTRVTNYRHYEASVTPVTNETTTYTVNQITFYYPSAETMYEYLMNRFNPEIYDPITDPLRDKNTYNIKYFTTGGYPIFEYQNNTIVNNLLAFTSPTGENTRNDCIALIDHTNNPDRALSGTNSVYDVLNTTYSSIDASQGAMFTPWVKMNDVSVAPSFAYLISLANSVQTNPNWSTIAGVSRGVIPGASDLNTNQVMTRAIADSYMTWTPIGSTTTPHTTFINPILNVRPYGLTIWGNRTLAKTVVDSEKALYFLNQRSLMCEIKKQCFKAAESLMFEQNSDILWINFKSKITPLLDEMMSNYGISGYKILKEDTSKRTQLKCTIKVYPVFAVEDFDITVVLSKDEISVEE